MRESETETEISLIVIVNDDDNLVLFYLFRWLISARRAVCFILLLNYPPVWKEWPGLPCTSSVRELNAGQWVDETATAALHSTQHKNKQVGWQTDRQVGRQIGRYR